MNTYTRAGHRCGECRSLAESVLHEAGKAVGWLPKPPCIIQDRFIVSSAFSFLVSITPSSFDQVQRPRCVVLSALLEGRSSSARPTSKHLAHREGEGLPSRTHFAIVRFGNDTSVIASFFFFHWMIVKIW